MNETGVKKRRIEENHLKMNSSGDKHKNSSII